MAKMTLFEFWKKSEKKMVGELLDRVVCMVSCGKAHSLRSLSVYFAQ